MTYENEIDIARDRLTYSVAHAINSEKLVGQLARKDPRAAAKLRVINVRLGMARAVLQEVRKSLESFVVTPDPADACDRCGGTTTVASYVIRGDDGVDYQSDDMLVVSCTICGHETERVRL